MTITKAIEMIQNLGKCELESIKIMTGEGSIENKMQLICKGKADYLGKILHEIEPETFPCEHPNKLRDIDPDGKPYCMGCNQDL